MSEQICQCRLPVDVYYFAGYHQRVTSAAYWFTKYFREWQEEKGRNESLPDTVRTQFNERAARMQGTRVIVARCPAYQRECERRIQEDKLRKMQSSRQAEDAF